MIHYFDDFWNEERYRLPHVFPDDGSANKTICINGVGSSKPYHPLATDRLFSFDLLDKTQSFSFYTFDEDGTNRRENITDWALAKFRTHYADNTITKWDIFHATYAVLHHPEYRTRYAANLKRELPRIPLPPDLHAFAAAGKRLMELHIDYEKQPVYPLEQIEDPRAEVSFRVDRMRLNKNAKSELRYTTSSSSAASPQPPSTTASATAPPSNGSGLKLRRTSTASPPTPAPASSTIPTAPTTPSTSSASSARSSPSPSKPSKSSPPFPPSIFPGIIPHQPLDTPCTIKAKEPGRSAPPPHCSWHSLK
jgi:hypothetical protein